MPLNPYFLPLNKPTPPIVPVGFLFFGPVPPWFWVIGSLWVKPWDIWVKFWLLPVKCGTAVPPGGCWVLIC